MKDLRLLSGPWHGWWVQEPVRGEMRIRLFFLGNSVEGEGGDRDGGFRITGRFDDEGNVRLRKQYQGLNVFYIGQWNGESIAGVSQIIGPGFFDTGQFEIWPDIERDEEVVESRETALSHR